MPVTFDDVSAAAHALAGHVVRTPMVRSPRLSELLGAELHFKLENQQFTGSFKDRGAGHKLQQVRAASSAAGVVAASAGNHAQGVAYHARRLGLPATIVMPERTAFSKVERTEAFGAVAVLHGDSLLEATDKARELAGERGLEFVHPYDDEAVIAGQGTVALEMLADQPELEVLVVPIGGGGLISGMAVAARALRPQIRIVGVQAELCPAMHALLRGTEASLQTRTIADGIAVKRPGQLTRDYVQRLVDEIVLVDERLLERSIALLANQLKLVAEGAGAAACAAVLANPGAFAGRRVGVVVSGGNIDARLLSTVLLRGLERDGKVARIRVLISDSPGVLSLVARLIGDSGADIVDIVHERVFAAVHPRQAELDVVLETRGKAHVERILKLLQDAGFPARTA